VSNLPNTINPFPMDGNGNPVSVLYGITPGTTDAYTPVKVDSDGSIDVDIAAGESITVLQGTPAPPTVANAWGVNVVSSVPNLTLTSLTGTVTANQGGAWQVSTQAATANGLTVAMRQDVIADLNNSSTTNLPGASTFYGNATSTLGVAGIQVSLKTDQNCTVNVDQSPDGNNWDINDVYNYYASINNFGITTQAINSYTRVRVQNLNGLSTTQYFRLQTALCPVVEALPRSLDSDGHLKTSVEHMQDFYGFKVENTPTGEMRTSTPVRLVGATFDGLTIDTNFWTTSLGTNGTATQGNAQLTLSTGTTANNSVSCQSVRVARYLGGTANRFRMVMRLPDVGATNNTRRWGAYSTTDGAFFELNGTMLRLATRKSTVDTYVNDGSFNGLLGAFYSPGITVKTYELYWTNSKVWYVIGDTLLHTMSASSATWAGSMNLPVRFESINANGEASDLAVNVRTASIYRLGSLVSQPIWKYQAGTTAAGGVICKLGAGNLHKIVVGAVPTSGSVVTLYDGTTTAGSVISSMTFAFPGGGNFSPTTIDFGGMPFYSGLILVVATQSASVTVIYE